MGAYFDNNATTPLDPRVREAMLPWLGERFGNASSAHAVGQRANAAVEAAREEVARLLGAASPLEVVFTGSGTEANNAVVYSALPREAGRGRFVLSGLEHPSVPEALATPWAAGAEAVVVPPDGDGVVGAVRFLAEVRPGDALAALMLASNELGTLQPVAEVAAGCRERGVPVLCDAVQAAGKIPVSVQNLGADFVTIGAHKLHGPLGAAALWIRPGAPFEPLLVGGAQERRRRASTVNVAAIAGFGEACRIAREELAERSSRLAALRDRFETAVLAAVPGARIHGRSVPRLPSTSSVAFPGVVQQELMIRLDLEGFQVSIGSACASGQIEPSRALTLMGLERAVAIGTIRVSFGLLNRPEEVDAFVPRLAEAVAALRGGEPAEGAG